MNRSEPGDAAADHDVSMPPTAAASATAGRPRGWSRTSRRRFFETWAPALAVVGLIWLGHLVFGANRNASALAMGGAWCVAAAALIYAAPRFAGRRGVLAVPVITVGLFLGVLAVGVVQLVGFPIGGAPHPMWSLVDVRPAITLDKDATTRELFKLVALAAAFMAGLVVGRSDKAAQSFFRAMLAAGAAYALWAFLSYFLHPGYIYDVPKTIHADRLTASLLSANSAATVMGVIGLVGAAGLARALKEASSASRTRAAFIDRLFRFGGLAAIAFFLATTCLLLTASRAGAGAYFASLLLFAAWEIASGAAGRVRARGVAALAGIAGFAVFAIMLASGAATSDRLADTLEDATSGRFVILAAHWNAFLAAPWLGQGLGSFPAVNDILQTSQNHYILEPVNAAHNVYLEWLEEAGVVGAFFMFATVAVIVFRIWTGLRARMRMRTWLRMALAVSGFILVHGAFDFGLQVPSIAWMWAALLGVGFGLAQPVADDGAAPRAA